MVSDAALLIVLDSGLSPRGGDCDERAFEESSIFSSVPANVNPLSLMNFEVSSGRTEIIRAAPSTRD